MSDAAGNVLSGCAANVICQELAYDEYGRSTTATTGEQFRYTGRRLDSETGLYYYRARYYSPQLGRFLQTDPIGYVDDLSLYSYAADDPADHNDPSGTEIGQAFHADYMMDMGITPVQVSITPGDVGTFALDTAPFTGEYRAGYAFGSDPSWTNAAILLASFVDAGAIAKGVARGLKDAAAARRAAKLLPKAGTGKGAVPPSMRDPKRVWTKSENAKQLLDAQGGNCANCGKNVNPEDAQGHHVERHADGGATDSENHAVVCNPCHKDLHSPEAPE
jgi:RHS repeat-associated protein